MRFEGVVWVLFDLSWRKSFCSDVGFASKKHERESGLQ